MIWILCVMVSNLQEDFVETLPEMLKADDTRCLDWPTHGCPPVYKVCLRLALAVSLRPESAALHESLWSESPYPTLGVN